MGRTALTAHEAATLTGAFEALRRGETARALADTQTVLKAAPDSPDARHLLALCLRDSGDFAAALEAFQRALERAPRHIDLLNNYGLLLRRVGRLHEALGKLNAAAKADPARAQTWINLALTQLDLGETARAAEAARRATELDAANALAWQTLGSVLRSAGDLEGAEAALRKAVALNPRSGWAWTTLGIVRRLIGDPTDALACYRKAREAGYDTPELADAEASAHLDLGEVETALAAARAITQAAPSYVAGHVLVAHILWEHGAAGANDPLAEFARAAQAQPGNIELRAALVNSLLEAERSEEALALIRDLRALRDGPALAAAHGVALLQLGQLDAATAVFEEAAPRMSTASGFCIAFARHLIRVARPDEAARWAQLAVERQPLDQEAWSLLGVAWRMLNDPREHWLCHYDRFVMTQDVEPPDGYADQSSFTTALAETLNALHTAEHAPLNQSLRGGTQTSGSLFGRRDPVIASTREALKRTVEQMIAGLPSDAEHPFLRRNTQRVRFTGSWSVRLRSSGRHVNHYHPKGWLSSAFYVQLPPSVDADDTAHAGWIQFGQPPLQYETKLTPRRIEQPKVGRLVLFPSYMWHGTVPFHDDAHRLTVAFDAIPA